MMKVILKSCESTDIFQKNHQKENEKKFSSFLFGGFFEKKQSFCSFS